jgi:hypothetical protein
LGGGNLPIVQQPAGEVEQGVILTAGENILKAAGIAVAQGQLIFQQYPLLKKAGGR